MITAADTLSSVVIDVGSAYTKAGFSGEEAAREVFRSVVGVPRHPGTRATLLGYPSDLVAGDEAHRDQGLLSLRRPVRARHVADWGVYEELLHYTLYQRLQVVPERSPFLLLEPADQTRAERERMAELLFEGASVPMLGLLNTSTATVYSTGRTSGVVIDSGAGQTMTGAVVEGYALAHAMRPSAVAGDYLTDQLLEQLQAHGYPLSAAIDRDLVERVKESRCRVAVDLAEERERYAARGPTASYELPDRERLFLFDGEFMVPEQLFDPSLRAAGLEAPPTPTGLSSSNPGCGAPAMGWAETVAAVVDACPMDVQEGLYQSIILGGGTSMLPDLERRLQRDVVNHLKAHMPRHFTSAVVKCVAFPERAQAAWLGGSLWACSPAFPHLCLTKADYHENGAAAVHKYAF